MHNEQLKPATDATATAKPATDATAAPAEPKAAEKPAKPAKPRKPAKAAKAAETPKAEPVTPVAAHLSNGITGKHYRGVSKYFSATSPAVKLNTGQFVNLTVAKLPPFTIGLHADIRATYGDKPFPARGLNNKALARLIAVGLLLPVTGTGTKAGSVYADGDKPLMLKLSAAGMRYGTAKA